MTFLRPEWLFLFLVWLPYCLFLIRKHAPSTGWESIIEKNLLAALGAKSLAKQRIFQWLLPLLGTLIIIACSGIALTDANVKVGQQGNLVVILDNSLSMAGTDIKPDRTTKAKRLIIDWASSGFFHQTSVITYSGSAHWLTPFTSDIETLKLQLQPLTPFLMPAFGNNPTAAFASLNERLESSGIENVHILWLTDDITNNNVSEIKRSLPAASSYSVIAIGTESGSPIPLPNNKGYLTDRDDMVIVKTDINQIHINATKLQFNILGLESYPTKYWLDTVNNNNATSRGAKEIGYWLLFPIVFIFLSQIRIMNFGFLIVFGATLLLSAPKTAIAEENKTASFFSNLFSNNEQRAIQALEQNNFDHVLTTTDDPELLGHALFGMKDYQKAADQFSKKTDTRSQFNLGNSLAHQNKFKEAIAAYDKAIEIDQHEGAIRNKELIEKFLSTQKNDDSEKSESSDADSEDNNSKDNNSEDNNSDKNESDSNESNQSDQNKTEESQSDESNSNQQSKDSQDSKDSSESNPQPDQESSSEQEQKDNQSKASDSDNHNNESSEESNNSTQQAELSEEEIREQQQIDATLNKLKTEPGSVLQHKFNYQHQQDPSEVEGTLW